MYKEDKNNVATPILPIKCQSVVAKAAYDDVFFLRRLCFVLEKDAV